MPQPREEQLQTITILDENIEGEVTFSGAAAKDISSANFIARLSNPTTGSSIGSFWVEDVNPTLPKFTNSDGVTITVGANLSSLLTNNSNVSGNSISDALNNINNLLNNHSSRHLKDGLDEIYTDRLNINFNSINYIPAVVTGITTDIEHLGSHLAGIDSRLGTLSGSIITDHGQLSGRGDDDHTQYLLVSGSRAMSGDLNMGNRAITNVSTVDGIDVSAHAVRHISGGADEIDGDRLDIDWNPTNYTPTISPSEVTSVDHLTAHLAGIDSRLGTLSGSIITDHGQLSGRGDDDHTQYLLVSGSRAMSGDLNMGNRAITNVSTVDGIDVSAHAVRHISGGADEIDGDRLDIDWNPTNYTPTTSPSEVTSVDHLTAHLAGINAALGVVETLAETLSAGNVSGGTDIVLNSSSKLWVQNLSSGDVPTSNPSSGGFLYAESGAGKWRGTSGTVTTFGPAEPHCPKCGRDFGHEWENTTTKEVLRICMPCMLDTLDNSGIDTSFAYTRDLI